MKQIKSIFVLITFLFIFINLVKGQGFQPENIGRGPVAVVLQDGGVYVSWRLLASDSDSV